MSENDLRESARDFFTARQNLRKAERAERSAKATAEQARESATAADRALNEKLETSPDIGIDRALAYGKARATLRAAEARYEACAAQLAEARAEETQRLNELTDACSVAK